MLKAVNRGYEMRSIILGLLLMLTFGISHADPLQGGNENVQCTLFGIYKTPSETGDTMILKVDVGLLGAQNATYELVDSKDNVYQPKEYKNYQPGRQMLIFEIPTSALFKFFRVSPTEAEPFSINWWMTPKGTNGDITLRYYGITDWLIEPELQAVSFDLTISNDRSNSIIISPDNFTLLDQWGWPYFTESGFMTAELDPKMAATHVKVSFVGLSPLSKPAALVYDYLGDNQIAIDLDKDLLPLSDEVIYGASAVQKPAPSAVSTATQSENLAQNQSPATASPEQPVQVEEDQSTEERVLSLKEQINATKERLKGVGQGSTETPSSVGNKIGSSIDEARQRLAMVRENL
jgi:hypothetical protein